MLIRRACAPSPSPRSSFVAGEPLAAHTQPALRAGHQIKIALRRSGWLCGKFNEDSVIQTTGCTGEVRNKGTGGMALSGAKPNEG